MATHLTEEEQIEALKRWWKDNWVTLVLPILVGVFLYVGWYWWQDYKTAQAEIASDKYETLSTLMEASEAAGGLTDVQKQEVIAQAEGIVNEHANTLYADLSNLVIAGVYVEDKALDKAANTINHVVQNGSTTAISLLAKSRLAKVYLAQGRQVEALALVSATDNPAFTSLFSEIRGDILLSQGNTAGANAAYKKALETLDPNAYSRNGLLQAKISASAVQEVAAAEPLMQVESADADMTETKTAEQDAANAGESE